MRFSVALGNCPHLKQAHSVPPKIDQLTNRQVVHFCPLHVRLPEHLNHCVNIASTLIDHPDTCVGTSVAEEIINEMLHFKTDIISLCNPQVAHNEKRPLRDYGAVTARGPHMLVVSLFNPDVGADRGFA